MGVKPCREGGVSSSWTNRCNNHPATTFRLLEMTAASQNEDDSRRLADWGREHGRAVRGYVLALVRRADLADDLTQEVFFRAWKARRRYREQGSARAYLLRIADRLVCDRGRKAGREITLDLGGDLTIDHVITQEVIAHGERVRQYVVEGLVDGAWQELVLTPFRIASQSAVRL